MTSAPVRDPLADHLLTPQNAALLFIDYQPSQLAWVRSMDRDLLVKNAVSTVKAIKTFAVPVVHSTINVASGRGQPTLPELAGLLTDDKPLDRTTTNSWEDIEFVQAVHATGRRKLIICALWTEISRLGPTGHGRGDHRDRSHRPPIEGAIAPLAAAAHVRRVNRLATRRQPKENTVLSISTSISIARPKP
jgi:hypothetical protein